MEKSVNERHHTPRSKVRVHRSSHNYMKNRPSSSPNISVETNRTNANSLLDEIKQDFNDKNKNKKDEKRISSSSRRFLRRSSSNLRKGSGKIKGFVKAGGMKELPALSPVNFGRSLSGVNLKKVKTKKSFENEFEDEYSKINKAKRSFSSKNYFEAKQENEVKFINNNKRSLKDYFGTSHETEDVEHEYKTKEMSITSSNVSDYNKKTFITQENASSDSFNDIVKSDIYHETKPFKKELDEVFQGVLSAERELDGDVVNFDNIQSVFSELRKKVEALDKHDSTVEPKSDSAKEHDIQEEKLSTKYVSKGKGEKDNILKIEKKNVSKHEDVFLGNEKNLKITQANITEVLQCIEENDKILMELENKIKGYGPKSIRSEESVSLIKPNEDKNESRPTNRPHSKKSKRKKLKTKYSGNSSQSSLKPKQPIIKQPNSEASKSPRAKKILKTKILTKATRDSKSELFENLPESPPTEYGVCGEGFMPSEEELIKLKMIDSNLESMINGENSSVDAFKMKYRLKSILPSRIYNDTLSRSKSLKKLKKSSKSKLDNKTCEEDNMESREIDICNNDSLWNLALTSKHYEDNTKNKIDVKTSIEDDIEIEEYGEFRLKDIDSMLKKINDTNEEVNNGFYPKANNEHQVKLKMNKTVNTVIENETDTLGFKNHSLPDYMKYKQKIIAWQEEEVNEDSKILANKKKIKDEECKARDSSDKMLFERFKRISEDRKELETAIRRVYGKASLEDIEEWEVMNEENTDNGSNIVKDSEEPLSLMDEHIQISGENTKSKVMDNIMGKIEKIRFENDRLLSSNDENDIFQSKGGDLSGKNRSFHQFQNNNKIDEEDHFSEKSFDDLMLNIKSRYLKSLGKKG